MKTATTIIQMIVRLIGLVMIVLGALFWTGNARTLVPIHMLLGIVLTILLWALAGIAARARVRPGLIILAVAWGLILPVFGMLQSRLLPGGAHVAIQILHLLVGLGALGLAEALAARIKRATQPALVSSDAAAPSLPAR